MNYIKKMFLKCGELALPRTDADLKKHFWFGSIGIRLDDCEVQARNSYVNLGNISWDKPNSYEKQAVKAPSYMKVSKSHAEAKLISKMDGGVVFVARVGKEAFFEDGSLDFRMARPCEVCSIFLCARKISKAYYTINSYQYGIIDVKRGIDIVKDF